MIDFTVCGNEVLTNMVNTLTDVLLQKGETFFFDYSDWFTCSHSKSNCHEDCCEMTYQLYSGSCGGFIIVDDQRFGFDETNKSITVDTSTGFEQEEICLRATSIGKVTKDQTMKIEVCGDEVITLNK